MIDGGCFLGHDLVSGYSYSSDRLLADFDAFGVPRGLVGSYRSLYHDVEAGNQEVIDLAATHPERIIPLALLHPCYYGKAPHELLSDLKRRGVHIAAVIGFPAYYDVVWSSPAVRQIGEAAARVGMALQAGIRTVDDLAEVARVWGDLDTDVLIRWMGGHRYHAIAAEIAVAGQCPRFVFDVGNMTSSGLIGFAAGAIGANRLYFASNAPHNIAAAPHAVLREAVLTDAQRALIEHGTLERVLGLGSSDRERGTFFDDGSWDALVAEPKVDVHWHPDHWNMGEPMMSDADQLATFDRFGYERVVAFSSLALNYDLSEGNALIEAWFAKDPRVHGLIVIDPLRPTESLAQIEKYAKHPRFVGLKTIQDAYGLELDDARYDPLFAAGDGLPVLAHMPGMDRAAAKHPCLTFIAAHANWGRAQRFFQHDNVCFDFATGHALRSETDLLRFVDAVGAERVMFGADGQLLSPAWSLAKLKDAALSKAQRDAILRGTAYRVFPKLLGAT